MRIAYICPRFYPYVGGVETHIYEIASRLTRQFEVEVLTTTCKNLPKEERIDGIIVRRFRSFSPSNAYHFSPALYSFIKKHSQEYDIFHAHSYHAFPALLAALATENENFIFTSHYHGRGHTFFRDVLHKPYKLIGRKIFEKAKKIICVSEFEKKLVLKDFNVNPSKVYVVPNGVNIGEFKKYSTNKDKSEKIILYVGRLEKYKGVEYLVKALPMLSREYILEIVGNGPYKRKLISLAEKYKVLDKIKFYYNLNKDDLIKRYLSADVLVLLSRYEAYGIVVAEALAARTPCIVANTSALSEWIDNRNVFGLEYPVDVNSLADLIENVAGKKVTNVKKLMSWEDVARKLVSVYMNLISE